MGRSSRGIFRRSTAKPCPHPVPSDPVAFDQSLKVVILRLSRIAECLEWWGCQARSIAERVAALGPWTWDVANRDWRAYHEGVVALLQLGASLSKMSTECQSTRDRIERARARLETRDPDRHAPDVWNGLVKEATDVSCVVLVEDHVIDYMLEKIEMLQSVLKGMLSGPFGHAVEDEPLAVDRDVHGFFRMPAHVERLEQLIDGALVVARAKAEDWIVSDKDRR